MATDRVFLHALQEFVRDPSRLKRRLRDSSITRAEKMLLQCWLDLRDNDYSQVLKDLERLPSQSDPLLESQRLLLTGIALNNKSEPAKAAKLIERCIGLMAGMQISDLLFLAETNLFFCHLNCKNPKGMEQVLKMQARITPLNPSQKITLAIQHLNLEKFKGNLKKAEEWAAKVAHLEPEMKESQTIQYRLSCFDLEVKKGDLSSCEKILQEMKKLRKFNVTANYKYMRILLDHLIHEKTVYAYHRNFGKFPNLEAQIQVIQCLESGSLEEALKWWRKLGEQNPDTYRGEFEYQGDACLFSMALQKHLDSKAHSSDTMQGELPVRKDLALQSLWGAPPADKPN